MIFREINSTTCKYRINNRGVTMLELIAILVILAIISAIAIPIIGGTIERAKLRADYDSLQLLNESTLIYEMLETDSSGDVFDGISDDTVRLETMVEAGYLQKVVTSQVKDTSFTWNVETQKWEYVDAYEKIIISLVPDHLDGAVLQIFTSFEIYIADWLEENEVMPAFNQTYASLSWSAANYTGTSQTNIFAADFWLGYFEFADTEDLNADNPDISDFKIFFKRDEEGTITSELVAVYIQMGGKRSIYFDNGVTVNQVHYSTYLDSETNQIIPPES